MTFGRRFTYPTKDPTPVYSVDYIETWYGCYTTRTSLSGDRVTRTTTRHLLGQGRCTEYLAFLIEKHASPAFQKQK